MQPVIRFDNVSKRYRLGNWRAGLREALAFSWRGNSRGDRGKADGILWALRDVSFHVDEGEAVGLIGPNGAGKTTVLKLLSRITRPTSGQIAVDGRVSALIELGAGFHPDLTGRENVYLNAAILGLRKVEVDRLFEQIVEFSGLERFIDTPIKRYSSGMYVRLGFSVAAHVEPDVLLVDEVLAVGDTQFRQRCAKRIEKLRGLGTTIVFVAHNLFLVKSICDRAIFLADGTIRAEGETEETIKAYEKWLQEAQVEHASSNRFQNSDQLGLSAVEIKRVDLRPVRSPHPGCFSSQKPAEIRVHFTATETIADPNLVLRIHRADGLTCAMIRTRDHGIEFDDLVGEGVISVILDPIQLSNGVYAIDARITGAIDGVPLAHANSDFFRVESLGVADGHEAGVFVPRVSQARVGEVSGETPGFETPRKLRLS